MDERGYWTRQRLSRRRMLRGAGLGLAGLAGAALIGCGDDEGEDGGTLAPTGPKGTATSAAAASPESAVTRGGTLLVGTTYEPSSLDAQLASNGGDAYFIDGIYDGILAYDGNAELDQERALSETYELVDETTIRFSLRKGVQFHDGTDFNSAAVRYNVERGQDESLGAVVYSRLKDVVELETPDDYTVVYHLAGPNPSMLRDLGGRPGYMLSPLAVESLGDEFGSAPVGTGPFTMVEYSPGNHVTLKAFPGYWRKGVDGQPLPYLEGVDVKTVLDPTARFAALTTGDLHIGDVATQDIPKVESNSNLTLESRAGGTVNSSMLVFNPAKPPADNVDVRRAFVWALDPAAVNQAVYNGLAQVADAFMYRPGSWVWQPIPERPTYNPEKARQFLAEAGYPDGVDVEVITHSRPETTQQTEIYQEQLRQVGIRANLTVEAISQATNDFFQGGTHPVYSTTWGTTTNPDSTMRVALDKDGFYNPWKTQYDDLQALIEEARSIYDEERRIELYHQIALISLDRALFVPMLYGVTYVGLSSKLQGLDTLWTSGATWWYDRLWMV